MECVACAFRSDGCAGDRTSSQFNVNNRGFEWLCSSPECHRRRTGPAERRTWRRACAAYHCRWHASPIFADTYAFDMISGFWRAIARQSPVKLDYRSHGVSRVPPHTHGNRPAVQVCRRPPDGRRGCGRSTVRHSGSGTRYVFHAPGRAFGQAADIRAGSSRNPGNEA